jgi:hypothetical protein
MKKTPRRTNPKQPEFLREAIAYVDYWVPRLRLENYDIEVVAAPDGFENYAEVTCNVPHLRASIMVRDPAKKKADSTLSCNDLEITIVHELVHVRFAETIIELDGKAHWGNETATEMTAMALVAARRGVNPRSFCGL